MIAHRLEGSRFGACFVALANSFHHEPGRKCGSGRLPGTSQRSAALWAGRKRTEPGVNASRWVIRGSRLLQHFAAGRSAGTNVAGSSDTRQSGSPPGGGRSHVVATPRILSRTSTRMGMKRYLGASCSKNPCFAAAWRSESYPSRCGTSQRRSPSASSTARWLGLS
jgi:hypothetical protein